MRGRSVLHGMTSEFFFSAVRTILLCTRCIMSICSWCQFSICISHFSCCCNGFSRLLSQVFPMLKSTLVVPTTHLPYAYVRYLSDCLSCLATFGPRARGQNVCRESGHRPIIDPSEISGAVNRNWRGRSTRKNTSGPAASYAFEKWWW